MTGRLARWLVLAASAVVATAIAGPCLSQTLGQGGGVEIPWWRVGGALALCLALAVGGAFALRTRLGGALPSGAGPGRRLRLVESVRLSHQTDVCLIRCDLRAFLIASTPQGAVLIGEVEARPAAASCGASVQ